MNCRGDSKYSHIGLYGISKRRDGGGGAGDGGIFNFSDQKRLFHVLFNGYSQVYSLYSLSCKKIFDIC